MTIRILEAARVLRAADATPLAPGTVVIDGDHIAWVGPPNQLPAPWAVTATIERINLPDSTILPGLIDGHVHLSFGGQPRPPTAIRPADRDQVATMIRDALARLAAAGVTSVRDLGAPHHVDADILHSLDPGPRVLTATIPLTILGGHCGGLGGVVSSVDDIERIIDANASRGADWIKVMVTGGFTTGGASSPYTAQFSDRDLAAVVHAARRHGLPVAAHAHGTAGIRQAVDAGVDSIEHCTWMTDAGFDYDPGIVTAIVDQNILVCPTINHTARQATGLLPWSVRRSHLQQMVDAGVRILPGSDSGIPHSPPEAFPRSLDLYRDLGHSPAEVIDLATRSAAQALGIDDVTGTLAAGLSADLLAVNGDPTNDLTTLANPVLVVTAGHLHYPAQTIPTQEETPA